MQRSLSSLSVMMMAAIFSAALVSCSSSDDEIGEDVAVSDKFGGSIPRNSEVVDLGLSVKWAPWNIGACKPSDYGVYFAWGETSPENVEKNESGRYCGYDWDVYSLCNGDIDEPIMSKYNETDGLSSLLSSDDPAKANWGGGWRMPTADEFRELLNPDNCECIWTVDYEGTGTCGFVVKSIKDNHKDAELFFPAANFWYGVFREGESGHYWSSDLWWSTYAYALGFYSKNYYVTNERRCCGYPVRAVCPLAE